MIFSFLYLLVKLLLFLFLFLTLFPICWFVFCIRKSVSDHFGTLCIKRLILFWDSFLTLRILIVFTNLIRSVCLSVCLAAVDIYHFLNIFFSFIFEALESSFMKKIAFHFRFTGKIFCISINRKLFHSVLICFSMSSQGLIFSWL